MFITIDKVKGTKVRKLNIKIPKEWLDKIGTLNKDNIYDIINSQIGLLSLDDPNRVLPKNKKYVKKDYKRKS